MRLFWGLGFALIVALGFWVGFRGGDEVQGSESAGFLPAPTEPAAAPNQAAGQPTSQPAGQPNPTPEPKATPPAPKQVAPAPAPAVSATLPRAPAQRPEEAAIAAALLHRPWGEVSVLLSQSNLEQDRRNLVGAVSAALAGDRERAQSFARGLDKSDDLDAREKALVASAVQGTPVGAVAASAGSESITAIAIALALRARDGDALLAAGRHAEAASAFSDVLLADATATWPMDREALQRWTERLNRAQAGHRWNAKGAWPSITVTVKPGDSLTSIRARVIKEHPEILVCTGLIQRVNQLRSDRDLHPGDKLRIPTERPHMLVDISTRWVLYRVGNEVAAAWEGGVGKPGHETVPGNYVIGDKLRNPSWFRPGKKPVPFGDPENPLGTRWLAWVNNGVDSSLGFHGTGEPDSVGGAVSSGCVRMRNEDVEVLFEILPEKAAVQVQP